MQRDSLISGCSFCIKDMMMPVMNAHLAKPVQIEKVIEVISSYYKGAY